DGQAPFAHGHEHFGVARVWHCRRAGTQVGPYNVIGCRGGPVCPPCFDDELIHVRRQSTPRHKRRIEIPHGARGGVARVGEGWLAPLRTRSSKALSSSSL